MAGSAFFFEWENELIIFIQQFMTPFMVKLMSVLTLLGEEYALVLVFGILYWGINKRHGRYVGMVLLSVICWNEEIKNLFFRLRPYMADQRILPLKPYNGSADPMDIKVQGYSFPSGHSANAAGAYGAIPYYYGREKKKRYMTVLAILVTIVIGITRIALGNHYPTDVLVGFLQGFLSMILISFLMKRVKKEEMIYVLLIVTSLPGFFYCHTDGYFSGFGLLVGGLLGFWYERKYVNFENAKHFLSGCLRVVLGLGIFLIVVEGLKLPFHKEFLSEDAFLPHMIRMFRYLLAAFIVTGPYTKVFKKIR